MSRKRTSKLKQANGSKTAPNKSRTTFTGDFKLNAVRMSLRPDVKVKEVANELGIEPQVLSRWRREYKAAIGAKAAEARVDAIAENQKLKDENKRLKMEVEILKKATVYFASQK